MSTGSVSATSGSPISVTGLASGLDTKSIVSALTGHPPNHPLVARGCISVMAPCALLLLVDRRKLQRLLPQLDITAKSAPQITRHLVEFALAGLRAISR